MYHIKLIPHRHSKAEEQRRVLTNTLVPLFKRGTQVYVSVMGFCLCASTIVCINNQGGLCEF